MTQDNRQTAITEPQKFCNRCGYASPVDHKDCKPLQTSEELSSEFFERRVKLDKATVNLENAKFDYERCFTGFVNVVELYTRAKRRENGLPPLRANRS